MDTTKRFTVTTTADLETGTISQSWKDEILGRSVQATMETRERGIRDALILLGWTPPPDTTCRECGGLGFVEEPRHGKPVRCIACPTKGETNGQ